MNLDALGRDWDVVVIGAGVAGAVAAYLLARHGRHVLLVEKASWPRAKACGGCVNAATLHLLKAIGLEEVGRAGGRYDRISLAAAGRRAELALPQGRAMSREWLDALLVDGAIEAGARFLPETRARLEPLMPGAGYRTLWLRQTRCRVQVHARLVLACDGLASRTLLDDAQGEPLIALQSRIGLGTTVDEAPEYYAPGSIHMACGPHGYVGLVRAEDARLNVGAALDPAWVKRVGGPIRAVAATLGHAGFPHWPALERADWQGTPPLTRKRSWLGAERVLVAGDAAGYVEPFTGEGMGWAVASAVALEPFALKAVNGWQQTMVGQWTRRHGELLRARRRGCQWIAVLLRRPRMVSSLLPLIHTAPGMAIPLTAWLNRDYRQLSDQVRS